MKLPEPQLGVKIIMRPENFNSPNAYIMRNNENPIETETVAVGTFNPGGTLIKENGLEKILLMIRVAISPKYEPEGKVLLPYAETSQYGDNQFRINLEELDIERDIVPGTLGKKEVTIKRGRSGRENISRLRHLSIQYIAKSIDGFNFEDIEKEPTYFPCWPYETQGIEDTRIIQIDDNLYILSSTSPTADQGVSGCLAFTNDNFQTIKRLPYATDGNKNKTPRPLMIGQKNNIPLPIKVNHPDKLDSFGKPLKTWAMLSRVNAYSDMSPPVIPLYFSSDFIDWGYPHIVMSAMDSKNTIGGGTNMVKGKVRGKDILWGLYHEVKKGIYRSGLFALDAHEPWRLVSRTPTFIEPSNDENEEGYVPNVVYPTALVQHREIAFVYSGKNDMFTTVSDFREKDCLDSIAAHMEF
jgi:beta-1,2-mannobiose phosphorylase / 1,2-beta-oligomannan phosphorylase